MKPIYRTKDIMWPVIIPLWVLIGVLLITSIGFAFDISANTPTSYVNSLPHTQNKAEWIRFIVPITLGFILLMVSLIMNLQVIAYENKIVVRLGMLYPGPYEIHKENIISIQPSPFPAGHYFPASRSQDYNIDKYGWRALVMSNINPGLMIQTKQRKYLISCPDAVKAAQFLRNAYGLPDTPIEPPPTWQD